MRAGHRSTLPVLLFALASCAGGGAEPLDARTALATVDVVVTPANLLMAAGARATFSASVTGAADTTVAWSLSEGTAAGSIDGSGVYVAPSVAGTYHVVATSHADPSRTAVATVTVAAEAPSAAVTAVTIAPTAIALPTGAQQTFTCVVSGGAGPTCTFAVQEGGAGGTIDGSGVYTAPQATGTYHVVVTSQADPSRTATAAVVVTGPAAQAVAVAVAPSSVGLSAGGAQAFACTVTGSSDTSCTFTVQEGAAGGTIDGSGHYTAAAGAGTYHVVASSHADPSKSATATVTVLPSTPPATPVITVAISPTDVALLIGSAQAFTCTATGSSDTGCTWSVQEGTAGGSVDTSGRYTAPSTAGTYHVIAASHADGTKTAVSTVRVTVPPPVVTVSIAPTTISLLTGARQDFSCAVTGSTDNGCTWSVQEGSVGGSVDSSGRYTSPAAAGTYHVIATSHADATKSASATVTVTAPPPPPVAVGITVSPATLSLLTSATQTFTCTVTGSSDTACAWSVQEGSAGGAVDSSGRYTAPAAAGTYHVVATSHVDASKIATATVAVTAPPPPITIAVAPSTVSLLTSATQTFTCSVTGSTDTACTWSVQEGSSGGSVDSSGRYTSPSAAGTYHVVATSHADTTKRATATVTVTAPPPPITVAISPATVSLLAGATQTFACTVTGSSDTACTYAVQEGSAGGSVSAQGVYTAPVTAGTYHVVATSHADATKRATAAVTVTTPPPPIAVSVTPASVAVSACQSVTLGASVSGSSNQAVTWSIQEGSAGGAISTQGVYTAPSTAGTYHAIATSQADATKSASAAIVVSDKVVSVTVSPASVSVQTGQTVQFTATVTTTCGAFASSTTVTQ